MFNVTNKRCLDANECWFIFGPVEHVLTLVCIDGCVSIIFLEFSSALGAGLCNSDLHSGLLVLLIWLAQTEQRGVSLFGNVPSPHVYTCCSSYLGNMHPCFVYNSAHQSRNTLSAIHQYLQNIYLRPSEGFFFSSLLSAKEVNALNEISGNEKTIASSYLP